MPFSWEASCWGHYILGASWPVSSWSTVGWQSTNLWLMNMSWSKLNWLSTNCWHSIADAFSTHDARWIQLVIILLYLFGMLWQHTMLASLVELWFTFGWDAVEPKFPQGDRASLICHRSIPKKVQLGIYCAHLNSADHNAVAISGKCLDIIAKNIRTVRTACKGIITVNLSTVIQENRTVERASDLLLWILVQYHRLWGIMELPFFCSFSAWTPFIFKQPRIWKQHPASAQAKPEQNPKWLKTAY